MWDGPGDRVVVEKRKEEEVEVGGSEEEAGFLGRFCVWTKYVCVRAYVRRVSPLVLFRLVFVSCPSLLVCWFAGLLVCWFVGLLVFSGGCVFFKSCLRV